MATEIQPTATSSALLIFGVSLCCAIEATGKFYNGWTGGNWERFKAFLDTMDPTYKTGLRGDTYGKIVWDDFRNGLAHGFAVRHGGFEGTPEEPYFKVENIHGTDSLKVNPSAMFDDYAVAFGAVPGRSSTAFSHGRVAHEFMTVFERVFVKGE